MYGQQPCQIHQNQQHGCQQIAQIPQQQYNCQQNQNCGGCANGGCQQQCGQSNSINPYNVQPCQNVKPNSGHQCHQCQDQCVQPQCCCSRKCKHCCDLLNQQPQQQQQQCHLVHNMWKRTVQIPRMSQQQYEQFLYSQQNQQKQGVGSMPWLVQSQQANAPWYPAPQHAK